MAYEHLVKNVRVDRFEDEQQDWIRIHWTNSQTGDKGRAELFYETIGAIETWLAQPKAPTPEERAHAMTRRWHESHYSQHPAMWESEIAREIREAIEADRAARGET